MVRERVALWGWRALWGLLLLAGAGLLVLHATLPADGTTGDLESFTPAGFQVQWLLEARAGGLQVGDVIVRAGGQTPDAWLGGAAPGPEWRAGGVVEYEILRAGRPLTLDIPLAPISLGALLQRWAPQFLVSLAILTVGSLVFWQRPKRSTESGPAPPGRGPRAASAAPPLWPGPSAPPRRRRRPGCHPAGPRSRSGPGPSSGR